MKYFISLLAILSLFLTGASPVFALSPLRAHFIKGSGPAVYYAVGEANGGYRYAFPNQKIYQSWYSDFSQVDTISDQELASYTLKGVVKYRPGARLVKITTDPKVYAVSGNGQLLWVSTEAVAQALYGNDWNTKVDDLPDAFFSSYALGGTLTNANQYSITQEQSLSSTIYSDLQRIPNVTPSPEPTPVMPLPTTPRPTPTAKITTSKASAGSGETVTLTAEVNLPSGLSQLRIYFDGQLQKTCEFSPCTADVVIPSSGVKEVYDARIDATWITLESASATTTLNTSINGSSAVQVLITKPEVRPGGTREIIVRVDSIFVAYALDIYIDNNIVKGCNSTQECRYVGEETASVGTTHAVHVIARNTNGQTRQSSPASFTVVLNERPVVSITPGKNRIFPGETTDITTTASDDTTIISTEIWLDGTLLKRCLSSTCTVTAGPWTTRALEFVGKATDDQGATGSTTSTTVIVQ